MNSYLLPGSTIHSQVPASLYQNTHTPITHPFANIPTHSYTCTRTHTHRHTQAHAPAHTSTLKWGIYLDFTKWKFLSSFGKGLYVEITIKSNLRSYILLSHLNFWPFKIMPIFLFYSTYHLFLTIRIKYTNPLTVSISIIHFVITYRP